MSVEPSFLNRSHERRVELVEDLAELSDKALEVRDFKPKIERLRSGGSILVHQTEVNSFPAIEARRSIEIQLGKDGRVELQGLTFLGDGRYTKNEDGYAIAVDEKGMASIYLVDASRGTAKADYGIFATAYALQSLVEDSLDSKNMQKCKESAHLAVKTNGHGATATAVGIRLSPDRKMDRMSCGDATLHVLRKKSLLATQINNLAANRVRSGEITTEQYYDDSIQTKRGRDSSKSLTTASLGSSIEESATYATEILDPNEEIVFVLASDCLRDWVSDLEIQEHLEQFGHNLNLLLKKLFDLVYNRGNGNEFKLRESKTKSVLIIKDPDNGDNMTLVVGKAKMPSQVVGGRGIFSFFSK